MTRPSLRISEKQVGAVTVLDLNGLLVLDDGDVVFRDAVNSLLERDRLFIVVNLADVTYIDSAGIGMLISRYLGVKRRGGDMKLANLTSRSHRVMTITHLLTVFDAFDSVDEAVQSFAQPAANTEVERRR
jgi:anti-sigma B factor antagonist